MKSEEYKKGWNEAIQAVLCWLKEWDCSSIANCIKTYIGFLEEEEE